MVVEYEHLEQSEGEGDGQDLSSNPEGVVPEGDGPFGLFAMIIENDAADGQDTHANEDEQ